ncbi:MAG: hypothetical protein WC612_00415 [Bdellovibrionales bacterium]|jgi:hypothetical protein
MLKRFSKGEIVMNENKKSLAKVLVAFPVSLLVATFAVALMGKTVHSFTAPEAKKFRNEGTINAQWKKQKEECLKKALPELKGKTSGLGESLYCVHEQGSDDFGATSGVYKVYDLKNGLVTTSMNVPNKNASVPVSTVYAANMSPSDRQVMVAIIKCEALPRPTL